LYFDARSLRHLATAMVDNIFAEVFTQVSPSATDANHYSLAGFADGTNEQFGRC
jgi:hypothetical protein